MNVTKKAELCRLLDTLPDEEIDRLIADGVNATMTAAQKAGVAYKSQQRSLTRFKASPSKLPALAEVLDLSEADLLAMDREMILDAIEALLDDLIAADDDEAGMLPSATATATKSGGTWVDQWVNGPPPARVTRKAAGRQPQTLGDLYLWSQGRL